MFIIEPDNRIIKRYQYKGEDLRQSLKNEIIKFLLAFENKQLIPDYKNQDNLLPI